MEQYMQFQRARQERLGTVMENLMAKMNQGESGAAKGARIGQWMFGRLVAPAVAAFGGPGTAQAGVEMMNLAQQQARQDKLDRQNQQKSQLDTLQTYGNLLNRAGGQEIAAYGQELRSQNMAQQQFYQNTRLNDMLSQQGAKIAAMEALAGQRQAKTTSEEAFRAGRQEGYQARAEATRETAETNRQTRGGKVKRLATQAARDEAAISETPSKIAAREAAAASSRAAAAGAVGREGRSATDAKNVADQEPQYDFKSPKIVQKFQQQARLMLIKQKKPWDDVNQAILGMSGKALDLKGLGFVEKDYRRHGK
jgi:hypothetical protein